MLRCRRLRAAPAILLTYVVVRGDDARLVWLKVAAINGFIAVAAGAWVAHGLRDHLNEAMQATFETGARYQMYHALALMLLAAMARRASSRAVDVAGWCFTVGIVLFSGSLYVLAITGVRGFGAITPFGGVAFLLGWLALLFIPVRSRSRVSL